MKKEFTALILAEKGIYPINFTFKNYKPFKNKKNVFVNSLIRRKEDYEKEFTPINFSEKINFSRNNHCLNLIVFRNLSCVYLYNIFFQVH